MEKEDFIQSIPEYLDGLLSKDDKKSFELHLKTDAECRKELEEYQQLLDAMAEEKMEQPSPNLTKNFEKMLLEEKDHQVKIVPIVANKRNFVFQILKVAASIAVLISAFYTGRYFESQKNEQALSYTKSEQLQLMQTTMISLMENQSASKRIQGVQYIDAFTDPDVAVVEALAERMLNDDNTNVRLTAMEALSRFAESEEVKKVFIQALKTEKDPSIQVAIIQLLVDMQEKKAIGPMQKLLENEETQPFIKDQINSLLPKII